MIKSCVVGNMPAKTALDRSRPWLVITATTGGQVFGDRFESEAEALAHRDRILQEGRPLRQLLERSWA